MKRATGLGIFGILGVILPNGLALHFCVPATRTPAIVPVGGTSKDGVATPPSHARGKPANPMDAFVNAFVDAFKTPIELHSNVITEAALADAQSKMDLLYLTPIAFYGRVVDQNGNPVNGAKINFSANTVPWGSGEKFSMTSDESGSFGISGKHGRSLFVRVSKEGYYQMPESEGKPASSGGFAYGSDLGKGIHSPSKLSPVVFVLRKAGTIEPLIARKGLRVPLQPDGTVFPVSLRRSQGSENRIRLSCHSERMPESGGAFNWSYEVSIENGELADHTDKFDFEAPTTGYRSADSGVFSRSLPANQRQDRVSRNYFIRFHDGTFARASLEIHAGAKPFVTLDGYLNPKPGSRNLEAGPRQDRQ